MPKAEYDKFWLNVQCTVDKDVVRTDRSHPYFAGNDNPNVEIMRYTLVVPFMLISQENTDHSLS
jgi:hypothetical protein